MTIAVSEVSVNSDTVAGTSGQVIMHDSNNETELTSCQLESERPFVKTKGGLRDFKTVAQFCDTLGTVSHLISISSLEKDLQRPLSNFTTKTNKCDCLK